MKAGFEINNYTWMKQSFSVRVNFTFVFLHLVHKKMWKYPTRIVHAKQKFWHSKHLHRIEKIQQCGLRLSFTRHLAFKIA